MFSPRRGWRRLWLAGAVGVLAAGCGPDANQAKLPPPPVAQPDTPLVPPLPAEPKPNSPAPPLDPKPDPTPTPNPSPMPPTGPGMIPGLPKQPMPGGGGFVEPTLPTFPGFDPPKTDPKLDPKIDPKIDPNPNPMPPVGPKVDPPKVDPPKPGDPPVVTPTTTPDPKEPQEQKFPDKVGGRDLKSWLKELEYGGAGPIQRDDHIRELAVRAIPAFGPTARAPAVKPLIGAITADPDPSVQVAAISVISSMGFDMREQVKPVIQVLRGKLANSVSGSIVRMYCVRSLGSFGPDAVSAVKDFTDCCRDKSWETRREVAIAISLIGATDVDEKGKKRKEDGGPNVKAIEMLLNYQLRDQSSVVRLEAVKSLLALGPPYAKTPAEYIKNTEILREAAADIVKFETGKGGRLNKYGGGPDKEVAIWAMLLQMMYDDQSVKSNIAAIAKYVQEPSGDNADQVRLTALQALGAAGKLSAPAVPTIRDALKYKHEPALILVAMNALALIGDEAVGAIPDLELIVKEPVKPLPKDAPAWAKPDDSLQRMAKQTIEVIKGTRKMDKYGADDPAPVKAPAPVPAPK